MGKKARLKKERNSPPKPGELLQPVKGNMDPSLKLSLALILFLSLFILGAQLRITNIANVERRSPDEGVYTYQTNVILKEGLSGIKTLVREHAIDKTKWVYPPPTRIGYLCLLAGVMKAVDSSDIKVGSYLSGFFSIAGLLLLIAVGVRFFNVWATAYAALFMAVSPFDLAISRRTWQDAMLGFAGLLLAYISCELLRAKKRLIWYMLLAISGSYCVLIKESGAVAYALCAAWILFVLLFKEKKFLEAVLFSALGAAGVIVSFAILSNMSGGVSAVFEVFRHIKEAIPTNLYAKDYQSGPWYQFFMGFWITSPLSSLLCIIGTAWVSIKAFRRNDMGPGPFLTYFMAAFLMITAVLPYLQNLRYVSSVYSIFYLLAGVGLWAIVSFAMERMNNIVFSSVIVVIAALLLMSAVHDYQRFENYFVKKSTVDLSIGLLLNLAG